MSKAIDKAYLLAQLKGYDTQIAANKYVAQETGKSLISSTDLAQIGTNKSNIETLVGTDTGKSVRTIANEELVAQLIPAAAQESLDTLEEIAAWIQAHPGDASAMNTAIQGLQTQVGKEAVGEASATGLVKDIRDLQAAIGAEGSVADAIKTAIEGLDSTKSQEAGADGLALSITLTDGKVTALSGSIAANTYDAYGSAKAVSDFVGALPAGATSTTVVGYISEAITAAATQYETTDIDFATEWTA